MLHAAPSHAVPARTSGVSKLQVVPPLENAFVRKQRRRFRDAQPASRVPSRSPTRGDPSQHVEATPPGSPAGEAGPAVAPRRSPSPHPAARPGVSFVESTPPSASGLEAMAAEVLDAVVSKSPGTTRPGILRGSEFIKGKRQKGANKNSAKGKSSKGKTKGHGERFSKEGRR